MELIFMKMRIKKPIFLLVAISFFLIAAFFAGNYYVEIESGSNSNMNNLHYPLLAEDHDPISIDGNAELAIFISNEGLSGDGTLGNPYIIEDFTINANSNNGIEISNTDAYITIQNCSVPGIIWRVLTIIISIPTNQHPRVSTHLPVLLLVT